MTIPKHKRLVKQTTKQSATEGRKLRQIAWLVLRGKHGRATREWARAFPGHGQPRMLATEAERLQWATITIRRSGGASEILELNRFLGITEHEEAKDGRD